MAEKFLVSITHGKNDLNKATAGFKVANAALASGRVTAVLLNIEGAYLGSKNFADDLQEEGFAPLVEQMDQFLEDGGIIWVSRSCFEKCNLSKEDLIDGASIVGEERIVEFLSQSAASITF